MIEAIFWWSFFVLLYFWLKNRIKHALYQKQREDFWREVIKRTEQKKKIDALYGRGQSDD
tara:strand:- start:95 stop:274 length:180 start_codon:yes stop_codon:yes gene_type:complete